MHCCLQFFLPEELAKLDASYVPPTSAAPDAACGAAASTSAAPDAASAAPEAAAAEGGEGGEGGAGGGVDGAGDASVQEATFFEKGPAA